MLQNVLAIAGAVMETAQHLHQLGVEVADAALEHGAPSLGLDGGLHLTAGLLHHFLDMGGMDTAVSDQLFQCQPGDLPADRLEAGDGDGLRCIVDDEIHTGQSLDGTDVAALAADDTALHLVIGQGNHTDGQLGHGVRRAALDGLSHHFAARSHLLFIRDSPLDLRAVRSLPGPLGMRYSLASSAVKPEIFSSIAVWLCLMVRISSCSFSIAACF